MSAPVWGEGEAEVVWGSREEPEPFVVGHY